MRQVGLYLSGGRGTAAPVGRALAASVSELLAKPMRCSKPAEGAQSRLAADFLVHDLEHRRQALSQTGPAIVVAHVIKDIDHNHPKPLLNRIAQAMTKRLQDRDDRLKLFAIGAISVLGMDV